MSCLCGRLLFFPALAHIELRSCVLPATRQTRFWVNRFLIILSHVSVESFPADVCHRPEGTRFDKEPPPVGCSGVALADRRMTGISKSRTTAQVLP